MFSGKNKITKHMYFFLNVSLVRHGLHFVFKNAFFKMVDITFIFPQIICSFIYLVIMACKANATGEMNMSHIFPKAQVVGLNKSLVQLTKSLWLNNVIGLVHKSVAKYHY